MQFWFKIQCKLLSCISHSEKPTKREDVKLFKRAACVLHRDGIPDAEQNSNREYVCLFIHISLGRQLSNGPLFFVSLVQKEHFIFNLH